MTTKKPPTHGGRRKNAGRKTIPAPLDVFSVRLSRVQADYAGLLGNGDRSKGIRELIDAAIDRDDLGNSARQK